MSTSANSTGTAPTTENLSPDFWKFWTGQAISALGSSFTNFALPLIVFKLTGSAVNLAISVAAGILPHLLFGLIIGAWTDRLDRKRLMILTDVGRATLIASIPLAAMLGWLSVWLIYAVGFLVTTLTIAFDAAEFAALPSLVRQDDLVTANGRIEASYQAATIAGPLLAGIMIEIIPIADVLLVDSLSFLVSAVMLRIIAASFNEITKEKRTSTIRQDIAEGLRYVLRHPVLRNISLMMAMVNFVFTTIWAQRLIFAHDQLGLKIGANENDWRLPFLWTAGTVGVIFWSLLAGKLRKKWSFGKVALGALMSQGALVVLLSVITEFWVAVPVFALMSGLGAMFNINTGSLRQAIVPKQMLGRVRTIAGVLAWSANPLGALLGAYLIEQTGNVALIFGGIGVLTILIPAVFAFSPLGHAEDYMPKKEEDKAPVIEPHLATDEQTRELEEAEEMMAATR
jgi:MFS family permease